MGMSACFKLYRFKSAKVTDKRVKVMNEIISGMRLIKMYAWEWAFHEYVKNIRKLVIKQIVILVSIHGSLLHCPCVSQEGEQDYYSC